MVVTLYGSGYITVEMPVIVVISQWKTCHACGYMGSKFWNEFKHEPWKILPNENI